MSSKYYMDNILKDRQSYLNPHNKYKNYNNACLTEEDFYPPFDNRVLKSNVYNIENGDNFADYCEYIFDLYEEENYYEDN